MVPPDNITTSSPTTNYTTKASGLTTAQPVLSYENKQSYAIPDQGSATSVINVTRTGDSGYVEITVDIKHESDVDLQITLYSPSEQAIVLRNDDPDGFARAHIHETYRIDMTGSESKGEWKLKVEDKFKEDHGTLKSWALNFQPPDSE
nr:proprotein convertase P-domain-containing protein [Endozoicomonas sp.]